MKNLIVAIVVAVALLFGAVFFVGEGTRAIVIQFGKVKKDSDTGLTKVYEPGLHFKMPFIDSKRVLDARSKRWMTHLTVLLPARKKT